MKFVFGTCCWLLLLVLFCPAALFAEEPAEPQAVVTPPGIAEVIPRLAELKQQSTELQTRLEFLQEPAAFTDPLQIARERAEPLAREAEKLMSPTGWNFDRLQDTRSQLVEHQSGLVTLLDGISLRLQELDSLRQQWQDLQKFWEQWRQSLPEDLLKTQRETFQVAADEIAKAQQQIVVSGKPLVALQDEVVQLQDQNQALLTQVDSVLQTMRGQTFKKTARSFTSPAFYRQFDRSLVDSVKQGIEGVSGVGRDFFRMQGWLVGLQLLLAACFCSTGAARAR
jgi:DNA repair exonuclease SbcCD ATPase subunit